MKIFLYKTFKFSLPIVFTAILLEVLIRNIPNDYSYKREYLDANVKNIETLILGNSHFYYGLNPKFFVSKAFNASHVSQSLDYDYAIFEKYKDGLKNIKNVILPMSYFTLFGQLKAGAEKWRVKNYIIYYDIKTSESLINYSEVLSNNFDVNIKRIFDFYFLNKSAQTCDDFGWGEKNLKDLKKDLKKTGKIAAERHTKEIHSELYQEIFQENIEIITSLINHFKENNINIYFITPPAYHTYNESLDKEQLEITLKMVDKFVLSYENCHYINLLNDSTYKEKDFFDGDHLSKFGAEKLSRFVNTKLEN